MREGFIKMIHDVSAVAHSGGVIVAGTGNGSAQIKGTRAMMRVVLIRWPWDIELFGAGKRTLRVAMGYELQCTRAFFDRDGICVKKT